MATLTGILVVLHMLCWAVVIGLYVAGVKDRRPPKGITHAALGALVFGVLAMIVALPGGGGGHLWYALKIVFALVAVLTTFLATAQAERNTDGKASPAAYHAIAAAVVVNIVIAVFHIGA